ncbi:MULTISPECIES: MFS transporter [Actinomadura]|uniref:MFS transporter n=1 Tax=Actinomadura yumaensis TaxID=111807 RepID=A0ABW2CLS4_9ACTN|nr:MFS transporter [Actinomadura sp. J1-007]
MRTYRELFGVPEFGPLFAVVACQLTANVIGRLALGVALYAATGSSLLSALGTFGPSLAQLVGAFTLLSVADRVPPRATMSGLSLVFAGCASVLALPGLPVWGVLLVILAIGLADSVGGGVRYGLLNEILPADGYILGRSVLNMAVGAIQIGGFALGGALITLLSPHLVLLLSAALHVLAALVARFGLTRRPARSAGRPSVGATLRVNRRLLASPVRRNAYLALWLPNGLVVGCEALFIPYAPDSASLLFTAGAFGMLAGDTAMGRFVPGRWRERLIGPLRLLLGVPYLLFAVSPPLPAAAVLVAVASFGFSATLLLQERLLAATPAEEHGQALGLHSSGMLAMQAVGASVAGLLADHTTAPAAMTVMAAASVAVTLALSKGLRAPVPPRPSNSPQRASAKGTGSGPGSGTGSGAGSGTGSPSRPPTPCSSSRAASAERGSIDLS